MRRVLAVAVGLALTACANAAPEPDATVHLTEFAIAVSGELPAGELAAGENILEVTNGGLAHHNLTLCPGDERGCDGDPIPFDVLRKPEQARDPSLIPDTTTGLTLGDSWSGLVRTELEPGRYRLFCAVINHAPKGMWTVVDVPGR